MNGKEQIMTEHPVKNNKWKRIGVIVSIATFILAMLANIVFVTASVARSNAIVEGMESFRIETLKGNGVQAQINDQLMKQLNTLEKNQKKNEKRLNRIDKNHRYTPLEWEEK